jgi:hypothetical protein
MREVGGDAVGSKIFDPAQICRAMLFDRARALDGGHVDSWIGFDGVIRVYYGFVFSLAENICSHIKLNDQ